MTQEEMQALLKELETARFSGALRVKFRERDVTYKSDLEMAKAISALKEQLAGFNKPSASYAEFGSGL